MLVGALKQRYRIMDSFLWSSTLEFCTGSRQKVLLNLSVSSLNRWTFQGCFRPQMPPIHSWQTVWDVKITQRTWTAPNQKIRIIWGSCQCCFHLWLAKESSLSIRFPSCGARLWCPDVTWSKGTTHGEDEPLPLVKGTLTSWNGFFAWFVEESGDLAGGWE